MRNTYIEILRFVLMAAILVWHTIVWGLGFVDGQQGMFEYVGSMPAMFFLCSLLAPATYCFVFISGYYGIKFSYSKLLNLLLWLIAVALICGIYRYQQGQTTWYEIYSAFMPLVHNRWWFVTAYVTLFIVSPFINTALQYLSKKQVIGMLLMLYAILLYRWILLVSCAGSSFIGLLFVYVLARFMEMNKITLSRTHASLLYVSSLFLMTLVSCILFYGLRGYLNPVHTQRIVFQVFAYCNPFVVIMAVAIFFFVLSFPPRTIVWLNVLLKTNLFIYLFTQGVGVISYKKLAVLFCEQPFLYVKDALLIILGALLVGHIVVILTNWITRFLKYLTKTSGITKKILRGI